MHLACKEQFQAMTATAADSKMGRDLAHLTDPVKTHLKNVHNQ